MQPADFFVVGGPVQPDRPCYVVREADAALADSIAAQRFTYVLERRAIGKSSLVGRCVQSLRRSGQLAAVVDLSQIGARGDGSDPARWYYSVAYRVLRELRLKLDLQSWWQDKAALPSEQRFSEFFAELVLAQTTESVTVFFDDIERTTELPFARQFYAALKNCYSRRVSEPEFERLNFVALGVATEAELCPDPTLSPFADGRRIPLGDFTETEAQQLAAGFDVTREEAERIVAQIYTWTRGHPYLTQKLGRGTVRRGGRLADVERAVNQQFLTTSAATSEPLLVQTRRMLTAPGPGRRQAVATLRRLGSGAAVADEPGAAFRERLMLAGVVVRDEHGRLQYRNRIFARVLDAHWARTVQPVSWRRRGAIAAGVAVLAVLPLWYTQYLPAPHIATLESRDEPLAALERAYGELAGLPGFGGVAERLLADALAARSRAADDFAAVREIDTLLRDVAGRPGIADALLGEYWLRAARAAMHAERRDAALLLALAARDGRPERARALAGELVGDDYGRLLRTLRVGVAPVWWEPDWTRGDLTLVDPSHRVDRVDFSLDPGPDSGPAPPPARITARQQVPVERELTVESTGTAGAFELALTVRHPRPSDLLVRLTAPSGEVASAPLPEPDAGESAIVLTAAEGGALAPLAGQERQGLWQLSVVDRREQQTGELVDWSLGFDAARTWQDRPAEPVTLPDPLRTEEVEIELSHDGRIALAKPTRASASGALAVWDLADGELVNDFGYDERPTSVQFTADARRLVVASEGGVTIWNVRDGTRVRQLDSVAGFVLAPAIGQSQRHVVVAERVEGRVPRYHLVALEDGDTLATVNGVAGVDDWVLGADAAYLALRGPGRTVRVLDPSTGERLAELSHQRDVVRVLPVPVNDNRLVTIDASGEIYVWQLGARDVPAESRHLATTADPESVSVARAAEVIAFATPRDHVVVRDLTGSFAPNRYRVAGGGSIETQLAPDAARLWTVRGRVLRLWSVDREAASSRPARQLSTVALDAGGRLAALGYDGGHVRVHDAEDVGAVASLGDGIDYIGHRGAVTALDVSAANGLVASGGSDGVVRLWNLDDAAPNERFLRHPEGPVRAVAVSPDGARIASGAEYSARVWNVADAMLAGEVPVNGAATALAFARDGRALAVGDSAGNLYFGEPGGGEPLRSTSAGARATAVAFAPDGSLVASGDAGGRVRIWDFETAGADGPALALRHPIGWLRFADASTLYVLSGDWLHRVERNADPAALEVTATRLLPLALEAGIALAVPRSGEVTFLGLWEADGAPRHVDFDMAEPIGVDAAASEALLGRDWPRALGLELDRATGTVRER